MPNYEFIEKITVLQHPETKNIARLMIEHDGNRNYGLQCSIVNNGKTRHFYNNKIWHSVYHIKDELERRVAEYEEKGFDVVTEYSLAPNKIMAKPTTFGFTDSPSLAVDSDVLPISAKDIPVTIACSFNNIVITDLRYCTQIIDPQITIFFENIRNNIDFLPFDMVAIFTDTQLKVLSLEFKSKPTPNHPFNYLRLLSKKHTEFEIVDAETLLIAASGGINFAHYTNNQLLFYIDQSWATANVYIEKSPYSATCKVFCIRDEQFHQIYQGEIANVTRSGNAEVKYTVVRGMPSEFIFISSLGFEVQITAL